MKTLTRIAIIALILAVIFVLLMVYSVIHEICCAEGFYEDRAWVLCQPGSIVNIRQKPTKNSPDFGGAECGTMLKSDGTTKNGFLYVYDIAAEETEGWVSTHYLVWFEPEEVNAPMRIRSEGRVACRKSIEGKIKSWARNGDILTVYWYSTEWAVTDRGYIMSQYLEPVSQK